MLLWCGIKKQAPAVYILLYIAFYQAQWAIFEEDWMKCKNNWSSKQRAPYVQVDSLDMFGEKSVCDLNLFSLNIITNTLEPAKLMPSFFHVLFLLE